MLNLFYGLEPDIVLYATLLAAGLATFFGVILCRRCPRCGWQEWVEERAPDGEDERAAD